MAEKSKVPKPKGLKSSLKGIPPVALIGVPVVAGVAFWLYSRKNKAAATSTTAAIATDPNATGAATGNLGSGFGGYGYSDPYSFQNSLSNLAGAGSTIPTVPATTTNDSGQTVTPQTTQVIPPDVIVPGVMPAIPPGGNVVVPTPTPTPSPTPTTPTPAETFINPPVKVTPPAYVAPTVINGKPVNPASLIPKGYTSGDYAATRAARLAAAAAAASPPPPAPARTSVLSGGSARGD